MEEQIKESRFSGWIKNNYNKVFIVVIVLAFIIRLLIFIKTQNQPLWWDEADYLSAAKKWGLGLDIRDIWYYRRGFFWPIFGAIFFKLGLGEIGIRFMQVLFSTGIVAVSYLLIDKMFNKKLALLVSIGTALSWVFLFFTGRTMTDLPAAFFILLSLLFFWKGYILNEGKKFTWLFGLFLALALLTRFQYAMFIPAFIVIAFLKEKFKIFKNKNLWIAVGVFLVVMLPFFIVYWMHYGNVISDILARYFGIGSSTVVSQSTSALKISNIFSYISNLPYILTTLIFVLFLLGVAVFLIDLGLGIDKIFSNEEIQKKLFVIIWLLVPMLILGYITVYVEQRYIMPLIPFLFGIAFMFFIKLAEFFNRYLNLNTKMFYAILIIAVFALLYSNYQFSQSLVQERLASYTEAKYAGLWIKMNSNPGDIIITPSVPQITYYSEHSTYSFPANVTAFIDFLNTKHPRYMFISAFEKSPDYVTPFFEQNKIANPVKVFNQNNQPVAIIYELMY